MFGTGVKTTFCKWHGSHTLWRFTVKLVKSDLLPRTKEFKYLGVLFTSDGENEAQDGLAEFCSISSNVDWTAVWKRELSQKIRLLISQSIYVPNLTSGPKLLVVTERIRSWIQAAEMSLLHRAAKLSLTGRGALTSRRNSAEVVRHLITSWLASSFHCRRPWTRPRYSSSDLGTP